MPRKRKSAAPQRADESKRQQMTWNMLDLGNQALVVVPNNDSTLAQELHMAAMETVPENYQPSTSTSEAENLQGVGKSAGDPPTGSDVCARELIDACDYYLSIYNEVKAKSSEWHCHLGTFRLCLTALQSGHELLVAQSLLNKVPVFWLYVNTETQLHLVYFELSEVEINDKREPDNTKTDPLIVYFRATTDAPLPFLDSLQTKCCFCLTVERYDTEQCQMFLAVHALQGALAKLKFTSDGGRPKRVNSSLQNLMSFFFGLSPQG